MFVNNSSQTEEMHSAAPADSPAHEDKGQQKTLSSSGAQLTDRIQNDTAENCDDYEDLFNIEEFLGSDDQETLDYSFEELCDIALEQFNTEANSSNVHQLTTQQPVGDQVSASNTSIEISYIGANNQETSDQHNSNQVHTQQQFDSLQALLPCNNIQQNNLRCSLLLPSSTLSTNYESHNILNNITLSQQSQVGNLSSSNIMMSSVEQTTYDGDATQGSNVQGNTLIGKSIIVKKYVGINVNPCIASTTTQGDQNSFVGNVKQLPWPYNHYYIQTKQTENVQSNCIQLHTVQKNHLAGNNTVILQQILKPAVIITNVQPNQITQPNSNANNNTPENITTNNDGTLQNTIKHAVLDNVQQNQANIENPTQQQDKINCNNVVVNMPSTPPGVEGAVELKSDGNTEHNAASNEECNRHDDQLKNDNDDPSELTNEDGKKYTEFNVDDYIREITCFNSLGSNECVLCDFVGKTKFNLRHHMSFKHPEKAEVLKCTSCNYATSFGDYLTAHIKQQHTSTEIYRCGPCSFVTIHKRSFMKHLRNEHWSSEFHKCPQCTFKTKYRENVAKHVRYVHDKSYVLMHCDICDFSTGYSASLRRHLQVKHKIRNPQVYSCDSCDFRTNYKRQLMYHNRVSHPNPPQGRFKCKKCQYTAGNISAVKKHMKIKHMEDIYQCTLCYFESRYLSFLKRHIRREHDEEIKHRCKLCKHAVLYTIDMRIHLSSAHDIGKKNTDSSNNN